MNQSSSNHKSPIKHLIFLGIFAFNSFFLFFPSLVKALSPTEIKELASKVVVGISGANQASGVIISKNQNIYGVLTTKEAIKQEGNNVLVTADGEIHFESEKKAIAQSDLVVVYFESEKNYPVVKTARGNQQAVGEEFYLAGYSVSGNNPKPQYRFYGKELVSVSVNQTENQGYQLTYLGAGLPGMSGSAILDSNGHLVGIYGKTYIDTNNLQANLLGITIDTIDKSLQQAGIKLTNSGETNVANINLPTNPIDPQLISKKTNIDYSPLRSLLAAQRWEEADKTTLDLMLTSVNRSDEGWFSEDIITNFPCDDLRIINQLWSKYSDNRFGFSAQKNVYLNSDNNLLNYNVNSFKNFAETIGWYDNNQWLSKTELNYSNNAPTGHLPASSSKRLGVYLGLLFSTCKI